MHRQQICRRFRFCALQVPTPTPVIRVLNAEAHAKIKCVMSALFSHAGRWEFCGHNPISSGIPVGTGGKRGPSTGVRISAKRQKSPLVLSPEQVKFGLAELEFRDQLLVFLEGALGIRQGFGSIGHSCRP